MPISGKEMVKRFQQAGWDIIRQTGSHVILGKDSMRTSVPVHGNKDLKKGLEKALLKQLENSR